jgi:hypothetical protein
MAQQDFNYTTTEKAKAKTVDPWRVEFDRNNNNCTLLDQLEKYGTPEEKALVAQVRARQAKAMAEKGERYSPVAKFSMQDVKRGKKI